MYGSGKQTENEEESARKSTLWLRCTAQEQLSTSWSARASRASPELSTRGREDFPVATAFTWWMGLEHPWAPESVLLRVLSSAEWSGKKIPGS